MKITSERVPLQQSELDLKTEWSEQSTCEPSGLSIDPIPKHVGPHPVAIFIDSTVENPELIENIGGGREVEITS